MDGEAAGFPILLDILDQIRRAVCSRQVAVIVGGWSQEEWGA